MRSVAPMLFDPKIFEHCNLFNVFLWGIGVQDIALKGYQELLGFGIAHPQQLSGAEVFQ